MNKIGKYLIFVLMLNFLLVNSNLFAQKAIVIHKNVGVLIDSVENFRYLTFTDYSFENFIAAQVFEYSENDYTLRIYLKNDKVIDKEITKEYIKQISDKIRYSENNYVKRDTAMQYYVSLYDGSVVNGKILSFSNININISTLNMGIVNIKTNKVARVENLESVDIKSIIPGENQHSSRYFYAPSAIPMEKGEGYFQDIYLLFVSSNYAVSNHTTIGGGFSILPGVGIDEQAFFVNAKIAYQITEKFYLGGGGLFFRLGLDNNNIGLGYAIGTYGSKDHNATVGIGYGFESGELMKFPVFTLCGMTRLSKRISLMTENWMGKITLEDENCYEISPGNYYCEEEEEITEFHWLFCYGLRFFSDKISVDLGFMNAPTGGELFFPGIPYIDFVVRF